MTIDDVLLEKTKGKEELVLEIKENNEGNGFYKKLTGFYKKLKEELLLAAASLGIGSLVGASATWRGYTDLKAHPNVVNFKWYEAIFSKYALAWIYSRIGPLNTFLLFTIPIAVGVYLYVKLTS